MKRIKYLWMVLLLFPFVALAQCNDYFMKIHRNGDVIGSYSTSEVDSITFQPGVESTASASEITVKHIYGDGTTYCAFTSLIKCNGVYYLAFREAETHVSPGDYGVIRILTSRDGETWNLKQTIESHEIDLRDPDLSEMPDGRLMLVCGARILADNGIYVTRTYCAFEDEKGFFGETIPANIPQEVQWETCSWVWRLTWHNGIGYGVCYGGGNLALLKTVDGRQFEMVTPLQITGNPNECQIRFAQNGTAYMMVRRSYGSGVNGYMGISEPPYEEWNWKELGIYLAGQDFLIDGEKLIVATRMTQNIGDRTAVWFGSSLGNFDRCFMLPYGGEGGKGDTAYAGILNEVGAYWISYYAIHDGEKPSIYLVKLPKQTPLINP